MAGFTDWMDDRVQKLGWIDMGLVKLKYLCLCAHGGKALGADPEP